MTHDHQVWIETLSERLRAPIWAVILLIGTGSYVVVLLARFLGGPTGEPIAAPGDIPFLLLLYVPLAIPAYVRRKMASLEEYALSMVDHPSDASEKLRSLSRLPPVVLLTILIFLGLVIPYGPGPHVPSGPEFLLLVATALVVFFNSTALWTLGYSLFGLYRLGRLPLKLREFTLDKILGLKPYASACLQLTGVYYLWMVLVAAPDLASATTPPAILFQDLVLLLVGVPLFLLPLLSLRSKLVRARSEKMAWINRRLHSVMQKIEAHGDGDLPSGLQNELLSIDKIQREIQSIKSWPFDVVVVAKLVTILLSVTAILLSAFIRVLLHF